VDVSIRNLFSGTMKAFACRKNSQAI